MRNRTGAVRRLIVLAITVVMTAIAVLADVAAVQADPAYPAPQIYDVTALDGAIAVSWLESDQYHAFHYVAMASPGGMTCEPSDAVPYSCTIHGVPNDVDYTVTVVASRDGGSSEPSAPSAVVRPRSDFSAPELVSFSQSTDWLPAAGGDIDVSARISDSGSGLAGTPRAFVLRPATWGAAAASTNPVALTRVGGDSNDGLYSGRLTIPPGSPTGLWRVDLGVLVDQEGNSTGSEVVPEAAFGVRVGYARPPTAVTASMQGRVAHVTWVPTADDGGLPVAGYVVRGDSGSGTVQSDVLPSGATAADVPVPDAIRDGSFSFAVFAVNATGWSASSDVAASVDVAPLVPDPPPATAGAGAGRLTVSWSAPARSNGDRVTSYVAVAEPGNHICVRSGPGTCEIPAVNGTKYSVEVTAINGIGASSATRIDDLTPYGAPTAPSAVHLTRSGTDSARVTWSASAGDGHAIDGYEVDLTPASGSPVVLTTRGDVHDVLLTLRPNVAYRASVAASSGVLTSTSTPAPEQIVVPDTMIRPPSVARPTVTHIGHQSATIRWRGVSVPGGLPVSAYWVRIWSGGRLVRGEILPGASRSDTERFMPFGTKYRAVVVAINRAGYSAGSPAARFSLHR